MNNRVIMFFCAYTLIAPCTHAFVATVDVLVRDSKQVMLCGDVHTEQDKTPEIAEQFDSLKKLIQSADQPLVLVEYGTQDATSQLLICKLWRWLETTKIAHIDIEARPQSWAQLAHQINRSRKEPALLGGDIKPYLSRVTGAICSDLNAAAENVCLARIDGIESPKTCQDAFGTLRAELERIPSIIDRLSPILASPEYDHNFTQLILIPNKLVNFAAFKHTLLTRARNVFVISGTRHTTDIAALLKQDGFLHTQHLAKKSKNGNYQALVLPELRALVPLEVSAS